MEILYYVVQLLVIICAIAAGYSFRAFTTIAEDDAVIIKWADRGWFRVIMFTGQTIRCGDEWLYVIPDGRGGLRLCHIAFRESRKFKAFRNADGQLVISEMSNIVFPHEETVESPLGN